MLSKEIGSRVGNRIPQRLGRAPYSAALRALQSGVRMSLKGDAPEIWARNSYSLGTLTPFLSDLDITVWFREAPGQGDLSRLSRILKWVTTGAPMVGEANVYVGTEAEITGFLINAFELRRDPLLKARLQAFRGLDQLAPPPADEGVEAAVFLLRMLEMDLENVIRAPASRARKWRAHLSSVGALAAVQEADEGSGCFKDTDSCLELIFTAVVEKLVRTGGQDQNQDQDGRAVLQSLHRYFQARIHRAPLHLFELDEWSFALFPHRYCRHVPQAPLRGKRAEICLAQYRWETWGLGTQYRLDASSGSMADLLVNHIDAMLSVGEAALGGEAFSSDEFNQVRRRLVEIQASLATRR